MKHSNRRRRLVVVASSLIMGTAFTSVTPAFAQDGPEPSAPAVVRGDTWYLRDTATTGTADVTFVYGNPGDQKLMGDWDGDGVKTPGVFRDGTFYLRNSNDSGVADEVVELDPDRVVAASPPVVLYATFGIAGDWNGDGVDGVGVVHKGRWVLFDPGETVEDDERFEFNYGDASDRPLVGDWDGDGSDTPGLVREATWFLRNENTTGVADERFVYGDPGDLPVPGDFDGDGTDSPAVVRRATWYVRDTNTAGVANRSFVYGNPFDIPLDW